MYKKLLKIYPNRIIENISNYDPVKYYYFYNEDGKLFGIEKTIASNEYQLIKSLYVEKTFHYDNIMSEKIHEYLFEKGPYPFNKETGRFLLYRGLIDNDQVNSLLKDIYQEIEIISYRDLKIVFYFKHFEERLSELSKTISDDFGSYLIIHDGIFFNTLTKGSDLITYINAYINSPVIYQKDYTDVSDLLFDMPKQNASEVIEIINKNILDKVLTNANNLEIIDAFFKNELNVSKTSKVLYMHRNSLLNKLDNISKCIGLNIQNFKHACAILVLMSTRK